MHSSTSPLDLLLTLFPHIIVGRCSPFTQYRNIAIEATAVRASTIHNLFQFDGDMKSKLDFSKQTADSRNFLNLDVLLLDEARGIYILPCCELGV